MLGWPALSLSLSLFSLSLSLSSALLSSSLPCFAESFSHLHPPSNSYSSHLHTHLEPLVGAGGQGDHTHVQTHPVGGGGLRSRAGLSLRAGWVRSMRRVSRKLTLVWVRDVVRTRANFLVQVGVEHLLRDINDPSVSSLAEQIRHKIVALRGLKGRSVPSHRILCRVASFAQTHRGRSARRAIPRGLVLSCVVVLCDPIERHQGQPPVKSSLLQCSGWQR